MSLSFALTSKSLKRPAAVSFFTDERSVAAAPSTGKYIREFNPEEAPPETEKKIKPIPPLPNEWRDRLEKLKNNPNVPADTRTFKEILMDYPDTDYNDYDIVPVEDYGRAILLGYGHTESSEVIKVPKVVRRNGRWGLGYTGEDPKSANLKQDKKRRVEKEERLDVGKEVGIVSGRMMGTKAERMVNWLRNHIRVRIISRDLKGGRLFLKKGVVVDVVGPRVCDVSVDESGELIQGVEQEFLETALPECGGPVLVLCGRYKGVYGTLLDRDLEEETGWVRDADTYEMLHVRLDQISEYTGDPGDMAID